MPLLELAEITLVGIVLAVLSIPPTLGWVPRNRMYGFRVPATLRTDPVWYAFNRRFGWELIAIGACLAATGAAFDAAGLNTRLGLSIANVALVVSLLWTTVRGWRAANRMERGR